MNLNEKIIAFKLSRRGKPRNNLLLSKGVLFVPRSELRELESFIQHEEYLAYERSVAELEAFHRLIKSEKSMKIEFTETGEPIASYYQNEHKQRALVSAWESSDLSKSKRPFKSVRYSTEEMEDYFLYVHIAKGIQYLAANKDVLLIKQNENRQVFIKSPSQDNRKKQLKLSKGIMELAMHIAFLVNNRGYNALRIDIDAGSLVIVEPTTDIIVAEVLLGDFSYEAINYELRLVPGTFYEVGGGDAANDFSPIHDFQFKYVPRQGELLPAVVV